MLDDVYIPESVRGHPLFEQAAAGALRIRKDEQHVRVVPLDHPVWAFEVRLTWVTPSHPIHKLHHAGFCVSKTDTADLLRMKIEDFGEGMRRTGLAPDGSNAETWTGQPTSS